MLALRTLAKALLFVLLASPLVPAVHAASIEKLIMPGPVSKAHAKIEGECSNCHDRTKPRPADGAVSRLSQGNRR